MKQNIESLPQWAQGEIAFLREDRDNERAARFRLEDFVKKEGLYKKYTDEILYKSIFGEGEIK